MTGSSEAQVESILQSRLCGSLAKYRELHERGRASDSLTDDTDIPPVRPVCNPVISV